MKPGQMKKAKTQIRLNKFLAECGVASRRKSDELIAQGRVTVNQKPVSTLGYSINPSKDIVHVDGERIKQENKEYFLLNKPRGSVSTTDDEKNRTTVIELIKTNNKIFPVGRLDYNTTGVLLLTNDGELANFLTHPRNKFVRIYDAKLNRDLTQEDRTRLLKGVNLEGRKSKFKEIKFADKNSNKRVLVSTVEGRNHFVKNMFQTLGYNVNKLDRVNFAGFTYEGMRRGEYRKISARELLQTVNYKLN